MQSPRIDQGGSGARVRRPALRRLLLVAAVIIGVAATLVVGRLRMVADDNRRTQLALGDFVEDMHALDAIEWRAIAQRRVSPKLRSDAAALHESMLQSLAMAARLAPPGALDNISAYHNRYMAAFNEEFKLLADGRVSEAVEHDETAVDPSFSALHRVATRVSRANSGLAEESIRTAETMSVLATILALLAISLLVWRFEKSEQSARLIELQADALRRSEEHFRSLVQNSSDVVMIIDELGNIGYVSTGAGRILGVSPEALQGTNLVDRVHKDDTPKLGTFLSACTRTVPAAPTAEFRFMHGEDRWIYLQAIGNNRLKDPNIRGIIINCRDVTERREMEQALRSLSLHDELTGLNNRRGFFMFAQRQLKTAARNGRELFLLFADLDGMKLINDICGHGAGDQALRDTAEVLRKTFRDSDIIARMGGDEFAVLGEHPPGSAADLLLARLRRNLGRLNAQTDRDYEVSLSVGVVDVMATPNSSIDEVLADADAQMYAQKRVRQKSA